MKSDGKNNARNKLHEICVTWPAQPLFSPTASSSLSPMQLLVPLAEVMYLSRTYWSANALVCFHVRANLWYQKSVRVCFGTEQEMLQQCGTCTSRGHIFQTSYFMKGNALTGWTLQITFEYYAMCVSFGVTTSWWPAQLHTMRAVFMNDLRTTARKWFCQFLQIFIIAVALPAAGVF